MSIRFQSDSHPTIWERLFSNLGVERIHWNAPPAPAPACTPHPQGAERISEGTPPLLPKVNFCSSLPQPSGETPSWFPYPKTCHPHVVELPSRWRGGYGARVLPRPPYLSLSSADLVQIFTLASPLPLLQLTQGPLLIFKISFNMEPLLRVHTVRLAHLIHAKCGINQRVPTSPRGNTGSGIGLLGGQSMALKAELQSLFRTAWGGAGLQQAPDHRTRYMPSPAPASTWSDLPPPGVRRLLATRQCTHGLSSWCPWGLVWISFSHKSSHFLIQYFLLCTFPEDATLFVEIHHSVHYFKMYFIIIVNK